ncbi:MAG: c-type cytochrome [Ferruginibacter sp.]
MKKIAIILGLGFFIASCGTGAGSDVKPTTGQSATTDNGNPSYDPERGEGKFTKVDITPGLNATMADAGEKVYGVKCSSCHKTSDEKLVGPGWKGVTSRHTAEWIMNFATNPDAMIDKDPKAKAMLEICLVRMPNQNLAEQDARALYEFMRKNDGVK